MVSKEPNHLPSANSCGNSNPDKAVTVRSVLLNRDSPDIETRLKRRRNRTQQVRFKDLEDGGGAGSGRRRSWAEQGSPHPNRKSPVARVTEAGEREAAANGGSVVGAIRGDMAGTIGAVAAILARAPPHPLTPAPMRRAWAPPRPCSLTLPNPRRPCMSMAIQTSPSLQKPLPLSIARTRSQSLGDFGGVEGEDDGDQGGTQDEICLQNHILPTAAPQDCSDPCSCQSKLSPQRPLLDGHQCLRLRTAVAVSHPLVVNSKHGTPASHPKRQQQGMEPPCPPPSSPVSFNGPSCAALPHSRKKCLGRAVSDPGKTVPPCASSSHNGPPCTPSPKTVPPSVLPPQIVPACTSPPKIVTPCALPTQTVQPNVSPPKTEPHLLPPKIVPNSTLPPKTVLCFALPPQTVQACASPPRTVIPCALPHKTVLPSALPLQTVLPCTFPAPTVPPCTASSQAPHTTQDIWRGAEREGGDRKNLLLPPPPPPPPPYTPRREGCCRPGLPSQTEPPTSGGGDREPTERGSTPATHPRRAGTPAVPQKQDPTSTSPHPSPQSSGQTLPQHGAQQTIFCTEPQANTLNAPSNTPGNTPSNAPSNTPGNMPGNMPGNPHFPPSPPGQHPPPGSWDSLLSRTADAALTPGQAETLKQVQELLGGLVSGARGKLELAKAREKLLGPRGTLHDIGTLQSQLQSLEGVLETSQNTIKVLLDVIQDLEKKEAERDGRHSYRTGQDIENCGTCRDCACIIYSVEHDFRLQEGQFTRAWTIAEPPDSDHSSPQMGPAPPPAPHRDDSPLPSRPPHAVKKSRRKCFWFL